MRREPGVELQDAEPESLAAEVGAAEPGIHLLWHAEVRSLVLDVSEVLLRVAAHDQILVRAAIQET
jgi:hypothetical protein